MSAPRTEADAGSVSQIPLTRGLFAVVDAADRELVQAHSWKAMSVPGGRWYARAWHAKADLYLHRLVMQAPKGVVVDHINGDGLDNRRCNLRLATPAQNTINRRTAMPHGYRGIKPVGDRWRAAVTLSSACFSTREEAARAYDALALEHYGEFAVLNFPEPEGVA